MASNKYTNNTVHNIGVQNLYLTETGEGQYMIVADLLVGGYCYELSEYVDRWRLCEALDSNLDNIELPNGLTFNEVRRRLDTYLELLCRLDKLKDMHESYT